MRLSFILILTILIAGFVTVSATIINVPADYDTIQVAINASTDGDTVLVADGHYYERINFYGKGILLTSEFMLDGDTMHIQNTIIDADTSVLGVADTGSVVCFVNSEDSTSVLQGFALQNGIGLEEYPNYDMRYGGGIYCNSSSPTISSNTINGNSTCVDGGGIYCWESSPTINNNTITGNSAGEDGGGICCTEYSSPSIQNNTISENSAGSGGGIYCYESSPTINNNTITGNSASAFGGGIYCWVSSSIISNNTISGNSAGIGGGGIDCVHHSSATINNNTISGNFASWDGGGIRCSGSSPTIINNTISGNSADSLGGGIHCRNNSSPAISNNMISENSADDGGGIWCYNSSPTINNNTISGNIVLNDGGGIFCIESSSTISNNTITGNSAGEDGGGIRCYFSDPTISSNTITGNSAYWGGGIHCYDSNPIISNNTISENSANFGGGIRCYNSNPVVVNTILWANIADSSGNEIYLYGSSSISITYSDIQDTLWPGEGNIDANPMFCFSDTAYYWLAENSPCVGSGQNGENMGAFGIGCEATDIFESDFILPMQFSLSQNFPNPFNASTTITFSLPKQQHINLIIYDLLGREVQTLIDEKRLAGVHAVRFNASHLSSGIYFYRLQAGDYSESKRMVLLK